jgi:hypothetical protein
MWNFRLILGLVSFLAGVVLAALAGWDGRFGGAGGFFVAGIAVAITVIFWDAYSEPVFWFAPALGAVLTLFSVIDVFTSSHAVNYKETEAQDDFLNVLIHLQGDTSPMSAREKNWSRRLLEYAPSKVIRISLSLFSALKRQFT